MTKNSTEYPEQQWPRPQLMKEESEFKKAHVQNITSSVSTLRQLDRNNLLPWYWNIHLSCLTEIHDWLIDWLIAEDISQYLSRIFLDICRLVVIPQSRLAEDISQFPLTSSCKNEIGAKRLKQLKSPEMVLKISKPQIHKNNNF